MKNNNHRFRLVNDGVKDNCLDVIRNAPVADKSPINVIITTEQEKRSNAQNRLYWKWLTEWGNHIGYTKDDVHNDFKYRFLAPIYKRDDVGYKNMANAVAKLKGTKEYPAIKQQVIKLTSTTTATTKQMNEYLYDIYIFCYQKGKPLTVPQDLEWVRPQGG